MKVIFVLYAGGRCHLEAPMATKVFGKRTSSTASEHETPRTMEKRGLEDRLMHDSIC